MAATTVSATAATAPPVETRVLHGFAPEALVATVVQESADLISVGMTRRRRAEGFLAGDIATELLHSAPCAVLAGRVTGRAATGRIVVGIDGSAESAQALAAARHSPASRRATAHRGRDRRQADRRGCRPVAGRAGPITVEGRGRRRTRLGFRRCRSAGRRQPRTARSPVAGQRLGADRPLRGLLDARLSLTAQSCGFSPTS